MQRHARSLRVLLRAWACAQENDRFCTRSYYLPVVNDTSQRISTVLYAHGNCGSRVHRAEACCTVSVKRSLVSGTFTAFRSWTPSTHTTYPAALHRHLCTGPLCTQRTRRGLLHPGLVYLNASHLPQASPCQSLPCTGVRALRGRNDIARLVSRSTRTHARARTAVLPVCLEWFDPSRGCVHAHARNVQV